VRAIEAKLWLNFANIFFLINIIYSIRGHKDGDSGVCLCLYIPRCCTGRIAARMQMYMETIEWA